MQIIKQAMTHVDIEYSFDFDTDTGGGYSFPSDMDGNVNVEELPEEARKNYEDAMANKDRFIFVGLRKNEWVRRERAVGLCVCGHRVVLDGFTNTCDNCERDYSMSGQSLGPRSQWGEETGESLSDVLNVQ